MSMADLKSQPGPACCMCGKDMFRAGLCKDCTPAPTSNGKGIKALKRNLAEQAAGSDGIAGKMAGSDVELLFLPCEDPVAWSKIKAVLGRPLLTLAGLDGLLTEFAASTTQVSDTFLSDTQLSSAMFSFFFKLPFNAHKPLT